MQLRNLNGLIMYLPFFETLLKKISLIFNLNLFTSDLVNKLTTVFLLLILSSGCATIFPKPNNAASKVKANAQLAVEKCGQGNVEEVTRLGFSCKKQSD